MADNAGLSAALDGIPMVADAAARDARFPVATRKQNQRVFRLDTLVQQRWSGSAWLDDSAPISSPMQFGAVGDGTADDTAAITAAITAAGPNGAVLYPPNRTFRCATKITFNQPGQWHYGPGATLLFDGANTTRLADVTATDNSFTGLTFNGNGKQPAFALVSVADNAARTRFLPSCRFTNLVGTSTGSNALNQMYALMISPYGVVDFSIRGVRFDNILKHNDSPVVGTPTVGWGFCGGLFFYNGAEPVAVQATPTSGVIDDCGFEHIQTILDAALSQNDRVSFDDADGIRFYGIAGGGDQLPVTVTNCRFRKVSKRAIKIGGAGSVNGVLVDNIEVDGSGLPYPMVSILKMDNESTARSIRYKGWASATGRVITAVDITGNANILVDGVQCDFAGNGIVLGPLAGSAISDVAVKNLVFADCSTNGYVQTAAGATHRRIRIEDAEFTCTTDTVVGMQTTRATDKSSGVVCKNVRVRNANVNIDGDGAEIDGLTLAVTSGTYAGPSTGTSLLTLGLDKGLGAALQQWRNITVDARGIATTWNTASRCVAFLYGDRQRVAGLRVLVPTGMGVGSGECFVAGDDLVWDGVEYSGPNQISVSAAVGSVIGGVFRNVVRSGSSTANAAVFVVNSAATTNVSFENVTDLITSAQSVVRLVAGGSFAVRGVTTKTTVSPIVDTSGATRCDVKAVTVLGGAIPTIASAATVTLADGYESCFISGTTAITSLTATGWEGRVVRLIFTGALTFTDGGNLRLAGNFVTTADDVITLVCAGGTWYEIARSAN